MIAETTGKDEEVAALEAKVAEAMTNRAATKSVANLGGIQVTKYEVPIKKLAKKTFFAYLFSHDDQLFATDHEDVAQQLIEKLVNDRGNTLSEVKSFHEPMVRCREEANQLLRKDTADTEAVAKPHVQWFVDPIGYAEVVRDAAAANKKRKRTDMTAAMKAQGFDAIRGAAGLITFGTEKYEIVQNAFVYAPPVAKDDEDKYKLAARVLAQSVADPLDVPNFVPDDISSFVAVAWDIKKSFDFVDTLVDEIAGEEGFFDDLIDSLKNDPNGPQIDIKKDLVAHLGQHVVAFTDAQLPVSPTSERMLLAIELTDAAAMDASIKKALETDPDARPMQHGDHMIWEIINEDSESVELAIEGAGEFGDIPSYEDDFGDDSNALQALWSNAAISVVKDYLVIASHTDLVIEMIERKPDETDLSGEADYTAIMDYLSEVGDDNKNCLRLFTRADREFRTSYELIRSGKMPESEGLMGRLLNATLAPKDKDITREQEIDGSKLPPFAQIQKHLGPLGIYCRPEAEGWYISGVAVENKGAKVGNAANRDRETITTAEKEDADATVEQ